MVKLIFYIGLIVVTSFPSNSNGQKVGQTGYKYGDKELRKFIEKNISFPAGAEEKNGCVLLALVKFKKGELDTVLTTINNAFGKNVVNALMKTKQSWKKGGLKNVLIPFYFVSGSTPEKIEMQYSPDGMYGWNKGVQEVIMISPVIITSGDSKRIR
jgi:hypothetical protein